MFDHVLVADGRIRPFFRFLISVVAILTLITGVGLLAAQISPPLRWLTRNESLLFWYNLLLFPALLVLYKGLTSLLDQRPFGSVGLTFYRRWKNEFVAGLAAGAVMILAVGGLERLLGVADFSVEPGPPGKVIRAGIFLLVMLLVAAADEELVFRGYPFQRLLESGGPIVAVAAFSVLFGITHLANPSHTWISTINTILVGVLLAVCYLRTRALWLPIGIHFAWNYVQGFVLGFPVSGLVLPSPILQARIHGPAWLTGGAYGPEGSILTMGVILAGTACFLLSRRIYVSSEMRELVLNHRKEREAAQGAFSRGFVPTEKL